MTEFVKKQPSEPRDYKERFEFRFTVGNNIICQRYFRINNFNPLSLSSVELAHTISECAELINNELKDKSKIYLELSAPRIFTDYEEMTKYFEDPKHCAQMHLGEGIVLRTPVTAPNYAWSKNNCPVPLSERFDNGEFSTSLSEEDRVTYKFAFYDNGREVCSSIWEGIYPKYVRNSIDLSNKRGKLAEGEDTSKLSFEAYVLYKMVEGKGDIVYKIIKDICFTCSSQDNSWYTTTLSYKNSDGSVTKYDNTAYWKELKKELKRLEAYEQSYR